MGWPAIAAAALAISGMVQALAGLLAVRRFAAAPPPQAPHPLPGISLLKPLHGTEPGLEAALASACAQDYPDLQILFGVTDPADPALAVVRRVIARFPGRDIAVVVNPARHGANGKVSNLINMLPAARHDVLVIADADIHAPADYLRNIAAALAVPGTGLVTTLYSGLPASTRLAARLGASGITHGFLPGALLARALGRQDCLGATMALGRATLERIGGLGVLAPHLADDHELGRRVRAEGLTVRLATTVPATTVPEATLAALFGHELRWARTIRALEPAGFAASIVQYPLAAAALAIALSAGNAWALALFMMAWMLRAAAARGIDRAIGLAIRAPVWLLPLRDLLSVAVLLTSYLSDRVTWRGEVMHARPMPIGSGKG